MFNHHQVEITVMHFRGHSLPVHHSVVYHGNYFVPFHQPISAHTICSPNCHWNVSLPSGASPWNSIFFWGRVEGQNITRVICHSSPCSWRNYFTFIGLGQLLFSTIYLNIKLSQFNFSPHLVFLCQSIQG